MSNVLRPVLNPRQKERLKETIKKATNEQIGQLFIQMSNHDPFSHPKNKLILPSLIRTLALAQIGKWIDSGELTADLHD